MVDPHDHEEATDYLKEALKEAVEQCSIPPTEQGENSMVAISQQEFEDMKLTMEEQGSQIRALTLGAEKSLVSQVVFIMRHPDIPWWSKPTLVRIARQQTKTSRYERRMKERELQGSYKFKKWGLDLDFTTDDVQRILYACGKVIVGVSGGTAMFFTAQEFLGNIIRTGVMSKIIERFLGL